VRPACVVEGEEEGVDLRRKEESDEAHDMKKKKKINGGNKRRNCVLFKKDRVCRSDKGLVYGHCI
jgi:hypothetical protein